MVLDIRSNVTCSLGVLIAGSIGDSYIQESGLITTSGSVEINGIITPAIGTLVTFSYTKGGFTYSIPRALRVMSSFADPYRRTTKVELGCKFTYFSDLQEPLNWQALDDPENAGKTADDQLIVTIPIHAKSVAAKCCEEIGVDPTPVSVLTNQFSVEAFDFSSGYVQILGELLVSEGYCGYLDEAENFILINLNNNTGSGPVYTEQEIIDLGPIGVGQLPGEAVIVEYSTLKLNNTGDSVTDSDANTLWEESIASAPARYLITYGDEGDQSIEYSGLEKTVRRKQYKQYNGKSLVYAESEFTEKLRAGVQGAAISQWLTANITDGFGNFTVNGNEIIRSRRDTVYTYDDAGEVVREETTYYGQFEEYLGKLSVQAVYDDGSYIDPTWDGPMISNYSYHNEAFYPAGGELLTFRPAGAPIGALYAPGYVLEKIITTYERAGDPTTAYILEGYSNSTLKYTKPKDLFSSQSVYEVQVQVSEQRKTESYGPWIDSIAGQQAQARMNDNYQTASAAINWINYAIAQDSLVLINVESEGGLTITLPDSRPAESELINNKYGQRVAASSETTLALGSAEAQRRITFRLPYAPDDTFQGPPGGPYTATASDAEQKAINYGRVQNMILMGNRSGMNLQLAPEKLPEAPFALMFVQANGLTAMYRANGNQWAFSDQGIACSTDALFWGAVGGTGTFFFPVAPGVVTLPTTPPTVDGQITVTTPPIPPYNETVLLSATVRLKTAVTGFDYSLAPTVEAVAVTTRLAVTIPIVVPAAVVATSAGSVTIVNSAPFYMPSPPTITISANPVTVLTTESILVAAGEISLSSSVSIPGAELAIRPTAAVVSVSAPTPTIA